MSTTTIRLTVNKHVTREQLISSVDNILSRFGCPACGLLGHGIILQGDPDPVVAQLRDELIREVPTIVGVSAE